jgi:putative SOS response-associated peptidase YedK
VHPLAYDAWLSPDAEPQDYRAVIENPGDDAEYEVFPVSKSVNSRKNDSPELVSRVSL